MAEISNDAELVDALANIIEYLLLRQGHKIIEIVPSDHEDLIDDEDHPVLVQLQKYQVDFTGMEFWASNRVIGACIRHAYPMDKILDWTSFLDELRKPPKINRILHIRNIGIKSLRALQKRLLTLESGPPQNSPT